MSGNNIILVAIFGFVVELAQYPQLSLLKLGNIVVEFNQYYQQSSLKFNSSSQQWQSLYVNMVTFLEGLKLIYKYLGYRVMQNKLK